MLESNTVMHQAHKIWLLWSCKKISHIIQVDVESENRVSTNFLISDCIYI